MTLVSLRLLTVPGLLLLGACASAPEISSLTPSHPASPRAVEAPAPPASDTLDVKAFATTAEPTATARAAPPSASSEPHAVTYTCPMHPDVTSPTPGTCPKCGMKLVPQKSGATK